MRFSSTCFRWRSDNEWFFQTPEDSLGFKLSSLTIGIVFSIGIFPPQYNPSSPFSFRMVRLWRMRLRVKAESSNIILLNSEKRVLLYLRDDKPTLLYPNRWALPGGYREEGETPEQCILREIEEELGIKLGEVTLFTAAQRSYGIEHTFWARVNVHLEDLVLTEGQAIRWFTFDEIKKTELGYEDNSILEAFFKEMFSSKGTL